MLKEKVPMIRHFNSKYSENLIREVAELCLFPFRQLVSRFCLLKYALLSLHCQILSAFGRGQFLARDGKQVYEEMCFDSKLCWLLLGFLLAFFSNIFTYSLQ